MAEKTLSREERRKIREKKRAEEGFPTKMNKYLWFVLFFANIVSFFDGWGTIAIMLAMSGFGELNILRIFQQFGNPDLFTYFGVSNSPLVLGMILSIAGTGVVAAISFKYFVDKYGRRPLTLITAIGFITFAVLTSISPPGPGGLIFFLVFRILANYFLSGDIVVIIMAEEAPDRLRGRLIGLVMAMSAFGGTACGIIQMLNIRVPIRGPWGPTMSNWQSLYFLNIIGFIFIIPLFFLLKETKRFKAMKKYDEWRKNRGLKPKTGWFAPLKKKFARPIVLGAVAGFLLSLVNFAQVTFYGLYFARELNMSQELIGVLTLPIASAAGLGAVVAGPLLDRWGRLPTVRRFSYLFISGATLYAFPTAFITGGLPNLLIQCLSVIGGSIGVFSFVLISAGMSMTVIEMLPTHIRSTASGWIGSITRASMIVVPFLLMFGAEKSGGGLGLSYQFMFVLMIIPILTAIFTIYLLAPESKGRTLEEIVISEVYAKKEETREKGYKQKYYLYLIAFLAFTCTGFLYGLTTDGTIPEISFIIVIFCSMSLICFGIVVYVREKIM